MNKTKTILLNLFIVTLTLCCLNLNASDFHAILVGDTHDYSIGTYLETDLINMEKEVHQIAKSTNLKLHLHRFSGSNYNKQLLNKLRELDIKNDDIVMFYYTGHGYHPTSKTDKWPHIFVGPDDVGIDYNTIVSILDKKNPKFLLSLIDCCNNYYGGYTPEIRAMSSFPLTKSSKEGYRKLFLETTGKIISCSSEKGQYSYCDVYLGGGYFTNAFLEHLHLEINSQSEPDWEVIATMTKENTYQMVQQHTKKPQMPMFELINLIQN